MVKLIVVRHGEYLESGNLTLMGGVRSSILGATLRVHEIEGKVRALSSTAKRAVQTAEEIASRLWCDLQVEQYSELYTDDEQGLAVERAAAIVAKAGEDADTVIVVTHHGATAGIPALFARKSGHEDLARLARIAPNSTANILDLRAWTLRCCVEGDSDDQGWGA